MDVFPVPFLLLPEACLLEGPGTAPSPAVLSLDQPNIGHHRHILSLHHFLYMFVNALN